MSNKLRKIGDGRLNEDEIDAILSRAIQAKFDAELKMGLERSLRQDYGISRENQRVELTERRRKNRLFVLTSIAAGLALLILAWNVFHSSPDSVQELAAGYLATAEIYHSASSKGNTDDEEARIQAILSFNAGEYEQAEQYFSSIGEQTEEDIFYSGISSLYNKKYEDGIAKLETVARSESRFQEEAKWWLAIACILEGDLPAARGLLSKMEPSSWNYEKTQELLKAFE